MQTHWVLSIDTERATVTEIYTKSTGYTRLGRKNSQIEMINMFSTLPSFLTEKQLLSQQKNVTRSHVKKWRMCNLVGRGTSPAHILDASFFTWPVHHEEEDFKLYVRNYP